MRAETDPGTERQALAIELLAAQHEPPTTREAVFEHADRIEEKLAEAGWRRWRVTNMAADDVHLGEQTARERMKIEGTTETSPHSSRSR